ncbi:hypothetical protein F5X98DRAFT_375183 [Xylaria grammica]|nr:hypothetical protein F5X98DRAFT_375183 [Xylaria grammica]
MSSYWNWFSLGVESSHRDIFWLTASPLIIYLLCCVALRTHQRRRGSSKSKHGDFSTMTLEEAYFIKTRIAENEFPLVFSAALNSVFFKAEGVPSIAKLVARAAQRASSANHRPARKPKPGLGATPADLLGRPGAPETKAAIDRVNSIHSLYRPSGKMSDDDLLYVLSLFTLETIRWIDRFEWRALTAEERCALAMLWRALGEELRIPFEKLPSFRDGFRDPLHWLAELEGWGRQYEEKNREKSPESVFLAQKHFDARLGSLPGCLRRPAHSVFSALIEPGLRQAMGIETPPSAVVFLVDIVIYARKCIRRHFCSPMELVRGYKRG